MQKYADLLSSDDDGCDLEDFDPQQFETTNTDLTNVPDNKLNLNYMADELYLNRKRTQKMTIRNDFVHLKDKQLTINLSSELNIVQYEHVSALGKGSFSINTKVRDVQSGEFFALKIYNIKELARIDKYNFSGETSIDKIRTECRYWSQFVNDHIPRLYEWYEREKDQTVIARSELGDIGGAGEWDEENKTYTISQKVYNLFLEKIINEDKVLRKVIPAETIIKDKSKENRVTLDIKQAKKFDVGPILEKKASTIKYKDLLELDNADDQFGDMDDFNYGDMDDFAGYGMDDLADLRLINRNSSILVRNVTTTLNDLLSKAKNLNKNIIFHQELLNMPKPEQRQYVIGRIFFDICIGLYYMHLWKVAHLDIKFDNFVISSKNNGKAMLIDFNSVKQFKDENERFDELRGTELFSAPEYRITGSYFPEKYDMFSLGCTLYTLYYGKLSCDEDFNFLKDKIYFLEDTPVPILTLMKGLLQFDPYTRWTWEKVWECLQFEMLHKKIEVQVDKPEESNPVS